MKTDKEKIEMLRTGIMCAIVHLFKTHPEDVCNMFTLQELEQFAEATESLGEESLEGIYKDILTLTE